MLRAAAFFLLMAGLAAVFGQESPKDSGANDSFVWKLYLLPAAFFPKLEMLPAVFQSKENPSANHYDVRQPLEQFGVTFPPGAVAVYRPYRPLLLVRNTAKELELVDFLLESCDGRGISINILSEIQTFECALPRKDFALAPSYTALESLSANAIKLLDHATILSKYNGTAETRRTTPSMALPAGKSPTLNARKQLEKNRKFADDESGSVVALCTSFGPDGTYNMDITYRFKMAAAGGSSQEFCFTSSFDSRTDRPAIIYSAPIPGSDGKTLVVVAKTRLISGDGAPFSVKPLPMAELPSSP